MDGHWLDFGFQEHAQRSIGGEEVEKAPKMNQSNNKRVSWIAQLWFHVLWLVICWIIERILQAPPMNQNVF